MQQQASTQNHQRFEQQQNWYQEQSKDKERAQEWRKQSEGENPFVRQRGDEGGRRETARERGRMLNIP